MEEWQKELGFNELPEELYPRWRTLVGLVFNVLKVGFVCVSWYEGEAFHTLMEEGEDFLSEEEKEQFCRAVAGNGCLTEKVGEGRRLVGLPLRWGGGEVHGILWAGEQGEASFTGEEAATLEGFQRLFMDDLHTVNRNLRKEESSANRYRALFDESVLAVLVADAQTGMMLDCNKEATLLTGYTRNEMVGMHQSQLHPPEVVEEEGISTSFRRHAREHDESIISTKIRTKDDRVVDVEIKANVFEYGGRRLIQGIFRDVTEERKLERELAANEEKYRVLFDESVLAVFVADAQEGILLDCNLEAQRMTGYSRDELLGMHQSRLHPPRDTTFRKHTTENDGNVVASQVVTKDGRVVEVEIKANLFEYNGRRLIQGIFRDVSEERRLQEALAANELKYRLLFEESVVAVMVGEAETGIIVECNRRAEELTGYSREELIGMHQRQFHPEEEQEGEFTRHFKRHKGLADGRSLVEKMVTKEGRIRTVEVTATTFVYHGKQMIQGFFRDITEEKILQEKLEFNERKYRTLFDSANDGIMLLRQGVLVDCNHRIVEMFERSKEEMAGRMVTDFAPEIQPNGIPSDEYGRQLAERMMKEGNVVFEYTHTRGSGEPFDTEVSFTSIKLGEGDADQVSIVRDVTERKATERELEAYRNRLEEQVAREVDRRRAQERQLLQQSRVAAIGEMLGQIAHHWRQPLNGLALTIQDVMEAYDFGELTRPYLKRSVDESMDVIESMSKTIDRFRSTFKRSEKGAVFDGGEAVRELLLLMRESYRDAHLAVTFRADGEEASLLDAPEEKRAGELRYPVFGLEDQFKQMMVSLLNNARDAVDRKFCKAEDCRNGGRIRVTVADADGKVEIRVEDNGAGVPEEIGDRIFDPYFTTKAVGEGTGVSLFMAKSVVEGEMGGTLAYENLEEGCRFTVTIPRADGNPE